MSNAAGSVTLQLDSKSAEKIANEHYMLQLGAPIRVPYLSQPRVALQALSFVNSFTNVDGTHHNNNKVRLAWKVHDPTHTTTDYDDLAWQTTEITLPPSYQTTATLEENIAKAILTQSKAGATFGTDLYTTLNRMVANKPSYGIADEPAAIAANGTRTLPSLRITSRCWFYGPHAKQWFYPTASGSENSIVVVIDTPTQYKETYLTANGREGDEWGAWGYTGFGERYQGSAYNGKRHWYDNLPEYLLGSSLASVHDIYTHAADGKSLDDITAYIGLVPGMRITRVFGDDRAREAWGSGDNAAKRPPGVYERPSHSDTPNYYGSDSDATANGTFAFEIDLGTHAAAFKAKHPDAVSASDHKMTGEYGASSADLWAYSGNFWPTTKAYDTTSHEWQTAFDVDGLFAEDKTCVSITLHPPAVAQEADWNRVIESASSTAEQVTSAKTSIRTGQSGEAQAYRAYGAGRLATTVLNGGDWANALSGPELQSIITQKPMGTHNPNSIVMGYPPGDGSIQQWGRSIKPITFLDTTSDTTGHRGLGFLTAWPGLYVCKGSTAFTELLGFADDDLCTFPDGDHKPSVAEMSKQNPFLDTNGLVRPPDTRKDGILTVKKSSNVLNVRQLCFHCPSLAPTSYLPDGSLGGNQLASVPVEVSANQMQSWQAGYDMSVAAMIHGQEIDQIEFYCTNQDQEIQDLQGTSFSATVKIDWSDPIHLRAGEYGAERDPAVGAYDVEFRHER